MTRRNPADPVEAEVRTETEGQDHSALDDILGQSPAIAQVKALVRQVAATDITVLITGESGTGKELVARAIHQLSARRRGPLVTLNCGAIPEGIFESEIFGHERGSFTSADQRRVGYFEMADRGTLFLDEIGEMPLAVQVKMLRVLEVGGFMRVGGTREIRVDVRLIAATNKDLGLETEAGRFRRDLYFRLKAVSIALPPLRERAEDIPILAEHFAAEFARRNRQPKPEFAPGCLSLMERAYWSGNVRELKNFVESLVALSPEGIITLEEVRRRLVTVSGSANLPVVVTQPQGEPERELIYRTLLELRQEIAAVKRLLQQLAGGYREPVYPPEDVVDVESSNLSEMEREQIKRVLTEMRGNRRKAARALGIGERTLYRKIRQYNLK